MLHDGNHHHVLPLEDNDPLVQLLLEQRRQFMAQVGVSTPNELALWFRGIQVFPAPTLIPATSGTNATTTATDETQKTLDLLGQLADAFSMTPMTSDGEDNVGDVTVDESGEYNRLEWSSEDYFTVKEFMDYCLQLDTATSVGKFLCKGSIRNIFPRSKADLLRL